MPGQHDDWTLVKNPFRSIAGAHRARPAATSDVTSTDAISSQGVEAQASASATRRRRWPLVASATAVALVATGAVAYGSAKKTVELDVDGEVATVSTYAGSVEGLLAEEGVRVTDRDLIAPGADAPLKNGADVVVRYGRQVTVQTDGAQSDVWLTALDADEALETLAARGGDVRLVASRSAADGRAELGVRLDADGPVTVVADGESRTAPDGSIGVDAILEQQGIVLGEHDRVSVARDATADPAVSLVVHRVVVTDLPTATPIPFETTVQEDGNVYKDEAPTVAQEGVEGVHTLVERVTTVDGVEESREVVSDGVTSEPVAKIVVQGTKERPSGPAAAGSAREIGQQLVAARGWGSEQFACLDKLWTKESKWDSSATNPSSGAFGIPQSLPASKMASAGADWRTNPATQITWGLNYIAGSYGTPCAAWGHSQAKNWY
ncbi:aggregation-promoting factor C-terminal-like domain-containing protein [Oerskovia enterophila]|uniref:Resuscitation-promoting factor Rpf2 n=1 Tax=Oerskovia enterophila TaxID=43678 RepID=A0ABX2Y9E6_9CELL|nr:ubiquitin-like domain-containing protein [Oerskovia enterophila]OCI32646.1 resuscitation-promoting factor Rpf2 precursor [Oerskovia enterophila]